MYVLLTSVIIKWYARTSCFIFHRWQLSGTDLMRTLYGLSDGALYAEKVSREVELLRVDVLTRQGVYDRAAGFISTVCKRKLCMTPRAIIITSLNTFCNIKLCSDSIYCQVTCHLRSAGKWWHGPLSDHAIKKALLTVIANVLSLNSSRCFRFTSALNRMKPHPANHDAQQLT